MSGIVAHYNYWIVILLMMLGFYIVIAQGNLIKKLIGLNLFQTSVFMIVLIPIRTPYPMS
jgi:multicomponent Na+:H+ antiporter subunit C